MARYDNLVTNCQARLPGTPPSHKPQRNKYNAVKVKADGHVFDSKMEFKHYQDLKLLELAGAISCLVVHPEFLLQQASQCGWSVNKAVTWRADFGYIDRGQTVVVDVKGRDTRETALKHKMFRERFPQYELRIVKK